MPHSLRFLLSDEAAQGRMASRRPRFVVHCELADGQFVELDADSVSHGHDLACDWCRHGRAVSAAVRRVWPDGRLSRPVGRIVSETDFWDDDWS